jgi:hypothetical protein
MFDQLLNFIREVPLIVWITLAALLLILIIFSSQHRRNHINFVRRLMWYEFPIFGKLNALARNDQRQPGSKWYKAEESLCSDFIGFNPPPKGSKEYDQAKSYLSKAHEEGRHLFPWYGWLIVFILLVAEALSFNLLLASYMAPQGTTAMQEKIGYLGATVLAIVLFFLTHQTGHQLYKNEQLKKIREWFSTAPPEEKQGKSLRPFPGVTLDTNDVDDKEPPYIQLASRIPDTNGKYLPSYVLPAITLVFVISFGVISFVMREQAFEAAKAKETTAQNISYEEPADKANDITALMGDVTSAADTRAIKEINDKTTVVAAGAFLALALLFVAMQVVGTCVGYYFGFCGKESKAAAMRLNGFASRDEYIEYYRSYREYVANHVQALLIKLQMKMRATSTGGDFDSDINNRTFLKYVIQHRGENSKNEDDHAQRMRSTFSNVDGSAPSVQNDRAILENSVNTAAAVETETELRQRLESEIIQKLQAEKEDKIRIEIEARERARLGLTDN